MKCFQRVIVKSLQLSACFLITIIYVFLEDLASRAIVTTIAADPTLNDLYLGGAEHPTSFNHQATMYGLSLLTSL
ncbi:MAG: hypothetical protein DRO13_01210 [Thermoprotei archaeon]|nr:MAG: hypothetical protein DRO13_01210 [Thermoprotei archaeon]